MIKEVWGESRMSGSKNVYPEFLGDVKCPLGLICYPSCFWWQDDKCQFNELTQSHKGQWCWVRNNVFCQEGFCLNCQIYRELKAKRK